MTPGEQRDLITIILIGICIVCAIWVDDWKLEFLNWLQGGSDE